MKSLFILLLLLASPLIYGEEEEKFSVSEETASVVALDGLPSSLANGCVSVLSGIYVDHAVDFVLPGPETLKFERCYSSTPLKGNLGIGWNGNLRDWLRFRKGDYEEKKVWGCSLVEASGGRYFYHCSRHGNSYRSGEVNLHFVAPDGMTNGSCSEIGGQTNKRNQRVIWHPRKNKLVCYSGSNDYRTFHSDHDGDYYGVSSEKKANGSTYRYHLHKDRFMHTDQVECYNTQTKKRYSSLSIRNKQRDKNTSIYLRTSDDREIRYDFIFDTYEEVIEHRMVDKVIREVNEYSQDYLTKVTNPSKPQERYEYRKRRTSPGLLLQKKVLPNNRFLKVDYYTRDGKKDKIGDVKVKRHALVVDKVKRLKAPVGTTEESITTHRFLYEFNTKEKDGEQKLSKGKTHVFDAYSRRTTYGFDSHQLLRAIYRYQGPTKDTLYSKEKFIWGKKKDEGNLIAKYLVDAADQPIFYRDYQYDPRGNVIENRLYGRLTGYKELLLNEEKQPLSSCEFEIKKAGYSGDGFNLKLWEEDSNGIKTIYHYLPGTNLMTARFIAYEGKLFSREFYRYDENNVVVEKISDDGIVQDAGNLAGVKRRFVNRYKNSEEGVIGLPLEESHFYWEAGELILLKRIVSTYNAHGLLESQDTYDANNIFCYKKSWEYNTHNLVTKEVNALGEEILKAYDENDNLILEVGPRPGFQIQNEYDFMNRLICKREIHPSGEQFESSYSYDYLGNCTSVIDAFGEETRFEFDAMNRIKCIHHPQVIDENGGIVSPKTHMKYDVTDYPIVVKDSSGAKKTTRYNIRGQPLRVDYSDGTYEVFRYRLDGQLMKKREKNGLVTHYTRDAFGQILEEAVMSSEQLLRKKQNRYEGFKLVESIDAEGVSTYFTYDAAGRLTWTVRGCERKQTLYDALGRPHTVREWYSEEDYRATIKCHDFLDRLIEERLEDSQEQVFQFSRYVYDESGNPLLTQEGDQITKVSYDGHNNPTEIINAAGERTHSHYNYHFINEIGQRVLQVTTTDAKGYQTVDTYDARKRRVHSCKLTPFGDKLQSQALFYDLADNLCRIDDYCLENEEVKETITTRWTYREDKQLARLVEAEKSVDEKVTEYEYDAFGKLVKKTLPSGVSLLHTYDELGRLAQLSSDDGSIVYTYTYDLGDHILSVQDEVSQTATKRVYNLEGHMVREELANGLSVDYTLDALGRTLKLYFPDDTGVEYVYDAVDLKQTYRLINHERAYCHDQQQRNCNGQITQVKTAGNTGHIFYQYDAMGRTTEIKAPLYSQEVEKYDAIGNLCSYLSNGARFEFQYDDLNQLSQENNHSYRFNSLENRTEKDGEIHEYNVLNQLIRKGDEYFEYDKNGNLTARVKGNKKTCYQYDVLNRLTRIENEQQTLCYWYDPFNRRMQESKEKDTLDYLYIGQRDIGRWRGKACLEFSLLAKNEMSLIAAIELKGALYIPCHDLSGNIVALITKDGELAERYTYTAFGETDIFSPDGMLLTSSRVGNPWQFSSHRKEENSSLIFFGFRDYDAELGRWLTKDPAGFECGSNLYAYVHNSPLLYQDRFGLFGEYSPGFKSNQCFSSFEEIMAEEKRKVLLDGGFDVSVDVEVSSFYNLNATLSAQSPNQFTSFPESKSYFVGFVNGIANFRQDNLNSALHLAKLCNHNIYSAHSASFGFFNDLYRCCITGCGVATRTSHLIQNIWREYFDANPDGYICWFCHSRGAIDTKTSLISFPKELRDRITVIAVAPAVFIDRHLCKNVTHLVSIKDPVPCRHLFELWRCSDTIQYVKSDRFFADHNFTNPIYEESIQKYYEKFKKSIL